MLRRSGTPRVRHQTAASARDLPRFTAAFALQTFNEGTRDTLQAPRALAGKASTGSFLGQANLAARSQTRLFIQGRSACCVGPWSSVVGCEVRVCADSERAGVRVSVSAFAS